MSEVGKAFRELSEKIKRGDLTYKCNFIMTENHRCYCRYKCSNCERDMLIGGAEIPIFCYHCGMIGKIQSE